LNWKVFHPLQKDAELTYLAVRTMASSSDMITVWELTDRSSLADNEWNPAQVEVYDRMVVFETVISENWFGGYLAVDSITHAEMSEGYCETIPKAAEKTTVPPETTTPGPVSFLIGQCLEPYLQFENLNSCIDARRYGKFSQR
jgi:hypothetical protein